MGIKTVASEDLRIGLRDVLDAVQLGTHIVIERYRKPSAVVISYEQWQAWRDAQQAADLVHARELCSAMQSGAAPSIAHNDLLQTLLVEPL